MSARKPTEREQAKPAMEAAEEELGITTEPLEDLSMADRDAEAVKGGALPGQNLQDQSRDI